MKQKPRSTDSLCKTSGLAVCQAASRGFRSLVQEARGVFYSHFPCTTWLHNDGNRQTDTETQKEIKHPFHSLATTEGNTEKKVRRSNRPLSSQPLLWRCKPVQEATQLWCLRSSAKRASGRHHPPENPGNTGGVRIVHHHLDNEACSPRYFPTLMSTVPVEHVSPEYFKRQSFDSLV